MLPISSSHRRHHDNAEEDSVSSFCESLTMESTISTKSGSADGSSRDEVKEVLSSQRDHTRRIRAWRFAVTSLLLATAVAVTVTTWSFLAEEQQANFSTAFEQFSRTVSDAALEQQENIRHAYSGFSRAVSASAMASNATWPFYTMPYFESYGEHFRALSRSEIMAVQNFVPREERRAYETWAMQHFEEMVAEGHEIKGQPLPKSLDPTMYSPVLYGLGPKGPQPEPEDADRPLSAVWTFSPPVSSYRLINFNLASIPDYGNALQAMITLKNETVVTKVRPYKVAIGTAMTKAEHDAMHSKLEFDESSDAEHPHSHFFHPIHRDFMDTDSEIVAYLGGAIAWDAALIDLLPNGVNGIYTIIRNNCNQSYTYEINGPIARFVGNGDLHEHRFDDMEVPLDLALHTHPDFLSTPGHCRFSMHIYPSSVFYATYDQNTPEIFAIVVAVAFCLVTGVFVVYDVLVQYRNAKLVEASARSNAIVSNMFPSNIRDRLIGPNAGKQHLELPGAFGNNKHLKIKQLLPTDKSCSKPLADLFLETTVLFADISGFTAWSSVREPSQVFTLLETIYASFDAIARKRKVLKVETVGDCYVAVTGLPDPRQDHAVLMARFAHEILYNLATVTSALEVSLGPDTGDLDIRIGLNSGPVTGGILRGTRSRFQLFGDTMNTASRMESSGQRGKIHVSKECAQILQKCGKGAWLEKRADRVEIKGKGVLETYWLNVGVPRHGSGGGNGGASQSHFSEVDLNKVMAITENDNIVGGGLDSRTARLVDWNVAQMLGLIQQIVARRKATPLLTEQAPSPAIELDEKKLLGKTAEFRPLLEVREIITLPEFDSRASKLQHDPSQVELAPEVEHQLRDFVAAIATMYPDNAFHNFDHCSHVCMSVLKLMSRIVAPSDLELDEEFDDNTLQSSQSGASRLKRKLAHTLHDHTYGITSDPLTQFACVFSALIHDVDHTGVPNTQLIKENPTLGSFYDGRSVAEQNSLDLSWDLLMEDRYADLRAALYSNEAELLRFRQLVVNSVMATDITDKELKKLRNERWDKAFKKKDEQQPAPQQNASISPSNLQSLVSSAGSAVFGATTRSSFVSSSAASLIREDVNRKATIVIEHLIQASDVSHTMQHWHVYRKWNERFFCECYSAYLEGRAENDPSTGWYKGEMGFFDFYIIPLAKKLKDCGVFGKSSDEYLNYAINNRQEWENKGEEMVAEMLENFHANYPPNQGSSSTTAASLPLPSMETQTTVDSFESLSEASILSRGMPAYTPDDIESSETSGSVYSA